MFETGQEPRTFSDKLMDEKGRKVWWICMEKIEEQLRSSAWSPERVDALASVAAAAATQILEEPGTKTNDEWD